MSVVSFAKIPGAGSSAPVAPTEVAPEVTGQNAPAVRENTAPAAPSNRTFNTGEEDEPADVRDIRLPRINLVQPSSGAELKKIAPEGRFVFAGKVALPDKAKIVIGAFSGKFYREKTRWGSKDVSRMAYSEEEVFKLGGTTIWKDSRENQKGESRKPLFDTCVTAVVLVERPEGVDEDYFPHVVDGKAYGAALYELKSTAYGSMFVELQSKKATTNLFKEGYAARFLALSSKKNGDAADATSKPVVDILEPTSPELRAKAKSVAVGNA
jgi:hypothetical protein